jgi:ectoine hydroxylase-related dioxygenase (phytanoyl-CoA dioxygenase family)
MQLNKSQLEQYRETGFLFLPGCFSHPEIEVVTSQIPAVFSRESQARILEKDSHTVRTVFAAHWINDVLYKLAHHPRVVEPAMQMLDGDVYIHQFRINAKAALTGDIWQWHQDFIYWLYEDGMLEPRALTAAVFLDDVTEFNGPMLLVPHSHRCGIIETPPRNTASKWMATVIADLKYSLSPGDLAPLVAKSGIVAPKGPRGSVLFFHCNLVHGSGPNMSPSDRKIVFITFNSTANALVPVREPRPDFLANRDFAPVRWVQDDALLSTEAHAVAG